MRKETLNILMNVMNNPEEYQYVATSAVKFADALIKELKNNSRI